MSAWGWEIAAGGKRGSVFFKLLLVVLVVLWNPSLASLLLRPEVVVPRLSHQALSSEHAAELLAEHINVAVTFLLFSSKRRHLWESAASWLFFPSVFEGRMWLSWNIAKWRWKCQLSASSWQTPQLWTAAFCSYFCWVLWWPQCEAANFLVHALKKYLLWGKFPFTSCKTGQLLKNLYICPDPQRSFFLAKYLQAVFSVLFLSF